LLQRACFVACDKHVGEFAVLGGDVPGVLVVADAEAISRNRWTWSGGNAMLFEAPVVRGGEDSIMKIQILLDVVCLSAARPSIGRGANSLQFGVRGVADQTLDGQFLQHIRKLRARRRPRRQRVTVVPRCHSLLTRPSRSRRSSARGPGRDSPAAPSPARLAQRRTGHVDTSVDRFSHAVSDLIGHPASSRWGKIVELNHVLM